MNRRTRYGLVATPNADVHVSPVPVWDANLPDIPFWAEFSAKGAIAPPGMEDAPPGGLILRLTLMPLESRQIPFLILKPGPALRHSVTETISWFLQEQGRLCLETFDWRDLILRSNLPEWLATDIINSAWPVIGGTVLAPSGEWLPGPVTERLAAQAFLLAMFPETDSRELMNYGGLQSQMTPLADGRIPPLPDRLNATVEECLLSSAAWIVQVVRHYRETGDRAFLHANYANLCRAISWLQSMDLDGDSLPEGRDRILDSQPPDDLNNRLPGASIAAAGLYLAALESAIEAAEALKDELRSETYRLKLEAARNSVINHLWSGERFYKSYDNLESRKDEGSSVAALLGEWAGGMSGLPSVYGREITESAMAYLLAAHIRPADFFPPLELDAEGCSSHGATVPWLLEILLGQEAIRQGYRDEGFVTLQKLHDARWHLLRNPWGGALQYTLPGLQPVGGLLSGGGMASWNTLHALTGAAFDRENEALCLSPILPPSQDSLHVPLFMNAFWAWLDFEPGEKVLSIQIVRTFEGKVVIIQGLRANGDAPTIPVSPAIPVETGMVADLWPYAEALGLVGKGR